MAQKKLLRFAEFKAFPNALEYPKDMQGNWHQFFKNTHPVVLELACGRGEYAVGLARMFPDQHFLGLDIKGNRIWKGASIANKEAIKKYESAVKLNLTNTEISLLRARSFSTKAISSNLDESFNNSRMG